MTEKRFVGGSYGFYDQYKDNRWLWSEWEEVIKIMNNLDLKAREKSKALSKLQKENEQLKSEIQDFQEVLSNKEEEFRKPLIRLIDEKIDEQYIVDNHMQCIRVLTELRKEIKDV